MNHMGLGCVWFTKGSGGEEGRGGGDLTIYIIFVNLRGRKRGDFNGGEGTNILFILLKSFTLQFM